MAITTRDLARIALGVITLTGVIVLLTLNSNKPRTVAQISRPMKPNKPLPENNYFFTELTPAGDWLAEPDFDITQTHDPTVPGVIAAIRSYVGKGNWRRHLMIESIVLKNRLPVAISKFRLGWIIISEEDLKTGKNRDAALLAGRTDLLDADGVKRGGRTKPFYLEFLKAAKPVIKDGTLSRTLFFRIRVIEAQFEDGEVWKETSSSAKYSHRRGYAVPQLTGSRCTNDRCLFHDDGQGYCNELSAQGYHCQRHDFTYDPEPRPKRLVLRYICVFGMSG